MNTYLVKQAISPGKAAVNAMLAGAGIVGVGHGLKNESKPSVGKGLGKSGLLTGAGAMALLLPNAVAATRAWGLKDGLFGIGLGIGVIGTMGAASYGGGRLLGRGAKELKLKTDRGIKGRIAD